MQEDPFDKMIREVREARNLSASDRLTREINRIAKKPPLARPDAIVLCTMRHTCQFCSAVYQAPSHFILLRTGKNYIHNMKSLLLYADLPREHIVKEDVVPRCEKCWGVEPQIHFH